MNDYADRWAEREAFWNLMSPGERVTYTTGLSHAYTDVFAVFCEAFAGGMLCDLHTVFERLSAQWDDVRATHVVKGVL